MRCCVIGGSGFVGSYLTRLLVESGRDVVVLGRNPRPSHALPSKARYVSGDYGERSLLRELLTAADEVIDLAYSTVPKSSFEDPIYDIVSNLPQSVGLLQEAVGANLRKLVLLSSGGTVYGVARTLPITEDHPTDPISPYGITKLTTEKYAGMFATLAGLPVTVVRPGNAFGEGQTAFVGQGFIATAMQLIKDRRSIDIFGDPGTVRDYLHVSDIARGIIAALNSGEPGQAYNLGSGVGRNNMEVLNEIRPLAESAGYEIQVNMRPYRKFDVPANILDSTKIRSISGWQPQVSFAQGLKLAWEAVFSQA
jgi:UDP-glucose 4-epimerase